MGCRHRIEIIFEMGTLHGLKYNLQTFDQQVLTKNLIFCNTLIQTSIKWLKIDNGGKWVYVHDGRVMGGSKHI